MRAHLIATFILDGVAAVALIGSIAFGSGQITAFDGFLVSALLVGCLSAVGAILWPEKGSAPPAEVPSLLLAGAAMFDRLSDQEKQEVRGYFPEAQPTVRVLDTHVHPSMLLGIAIVNAGERREPAGHSGADVAATSEPIADGVSGPRRLGTLPGLGRATGSGSTGE